MEVISKNPIIVEGNVSDSSNFGGKWKDRRTQNKLNSDDNRSIFDKLKGGVDKLGTGLDKSKGLVDSLGGILGSESPNRGADIEYKMPEEKKGLSRNAKIGIGVGSAVFLGLVIFAIVKMNKK